MKPYEFFIEACSQVSETLGNLESDSLLLSKVMEQELGYIRQHNLSQIEDLTEKKVHICGQIERNLEALRKLQKDIRLALGVKPSGKELSLTSLKQDLDSVERWARLDEGTATEVLLYVLVGAKQYLQSILASVDTFKRELERNRTTLGSVLESRQESMTFWQNMADQVTSQYDAKGGQKKGEKSFFIKASA